MPQLFTVVTPDEAWLKLRPYLRPVAEVEVVATADALGRILAEDVVAPCDLPAFARSTMDGFAVRAEDTHGASESVPAYLTLVGEIAMGQPAGMALRPGEAALIHTGGMLARDADAVVMIENTREVDAETIEVLRPVAQGENVIQVGEEVARGEILLPHGSLLRPQEMGGLLAVGVTEVSVSRRVQVALISTGDELVPPENDPLPGQIRNTNACSLAGLVTKAGAVPLKMGIVRDNRQALELAVRRGLEEADMVVISAGSSVSTRDITADVVDSLGRPGVIVHGVSVRPGKPTILASVDGKAVFGLPGNPGSAMVIFELFVMPSIHLVSGCTRPPWRVLNARLTRNVASAPGRVDYVPVRIEQRSDELHAEPLFGKSNTLSNLIEADGLAEIPLDRGGLMAGEMVMVRVF